MEKEIDVRRDYSLQDAADLLGVSSRTLSRRVHDGSLDGEKMGRSYRISGHSLLRYAEGLKDDEDYFSRVVSRYGLEDFISVVNGLGCMVVNSDIDIPELDLLCDAGSKIKVQRLLYTGDESRYTVFIYTAVFPESWVADLKQDDAHRGRKNPGPGEDQEDQRR